MVEQCRRSNGGPEPPGPALRTLFRGGDGPRERLQDRVVADPVRRRVHHPRRARAHQPGYGVQIGLQEVRLGIRWGSHRSTSVKSYLDDGRVSTVTLDGAQLAAVSYDSAGQLSGVAYGPAGAPVTTLGSVTRNPAGAVTGQTWTVGSRTLGESLTRSQAGRITKSVATDSVGPASTVDWSYGYDPVGRLTSAVLATAGTRPTVTLGYGYAASGGCGADPAAGSNGSRTLMSRQIGTGTPAESTVCTDHASRVTSVNSSTGGLTVSPATVTYDAHGNLTQLGTQSWKYDGADRVSSTCLLYTSDAADE